MSESTMYNDGLEAYWQGKPITANPCNLDTLAYQEWKRGWYAAEAQEEADAASLADEYHGWEDVDLEDGLDLEPETNETDDAEHEKDFDIAFRVGAYR